ncbi:MAG: hypothetical protein WA441_05105 [Methyloceanibacter sp.]
MNQPPPKIKRVHFEVAEKVEVDGFTLPKGRKYNGYSRTLGVYYMGQPQWQEPDYFIELTKDDLKALGSEGEGLEIIPTQAVKAGKIVVKHTP